MWLSRTRPNLMELCPAMGQYLSKNLDFKIFFSNGYNIITFPTTPKMSTYLLAFCTGELTQLNTTASDGTLVGFTLFYLIFEKNV